MIHQFITIKKAKQPLFIGTTLTGETPPHVFIYYIIAPWFYKNLKIKHQVGDAGVGGCGGGWYNDILTHEGVKANQTTVVQACNCVTFSVGVWKVRLPADITVVWP